MRQSDDWGIRDGRILKFLDQLERMGGQLRKATDRRMRRQSLIRAIAECAEDGKVAVIESGMDCDCTRYSGHRHLIDANVKAYDALRNHIAEWADGVFYLDIARPSEDVEQSSRDLALEAFEDGRPYSIHV